MRKLILNDPEKCVGCNRCIRYCPIKDANIARQDNGAIKIFIDNDKCIVCGACLHACQHGARDYEDDTERFFADLAKGEKISVFCAPAARSNLKDWERILTWLRQSGVNKIYDVSLGADICTWGYIRWIQQNQPVSVISQACPVIVNYILLHNNDLLPYLAPVHSPMLCTAIYMKRYQGITDKIAAISPCIAKADEFEATGSLVSYNITFKKLEDYLNTKKITLPLEKGDYDHEVSGLGAVFSYPGGLKENVEFFLGKNLRVDKVEGQSVVYRALDAFGQEPQQNLPALFDVLNCPDGCNLGTGVHHRRSLLSINTAMDAARKRVMAGRERDYFEKMYEEFDRTLRLNDFLRQYVARSVRPVNIQPADLEEAFRQLEKHDVDSRHFDCGACGSETCMGMAEKVALKVNIPQNCIQKINKDVVQQQSNVRNTTGAIESIETEIGRISDSSTGIINDLQGINKVIGNYTHMAQEIAKIADNIHIISLNASIEAAKAGDQGRSFAVVAEAIRALARETQKATTKISDSSQDTRQAIGVITEKMTAIITDIGNSHNTVREIASTTKKLIHP